MTDYERLLARIRAVRRCWRLQQLSRGAALLAVSLVLLAVLGVAAANLLGFSDAAVLAARTLTGLAALLCLARFLYIPLRRRVSDVQVAQYVEERFPGLQDRLVSAVEPLLVQWQGSIVDADIEGAEGFIEYRRVAPDGPGRHVVDHEQGRQAPGGLDLGVVGRLELRQEEGHDAPLPPHELRPEGVERKKVEVAVLDPAPEVLPVEV